MIERDTILSLLHSVRHSFSLLLFPSLLCDRRHNLKISISIVSVECCRSKSKIILTCGGRASFSRLSGFCSLLSHMYISSISMNFLILLLDDLNSSLHCIDLCIRLVTQHVENWSFFGVLQALLEANEILRNIEAALEVQWFH